MTALERIKEIEGTCQVQNCNECYNHFLLKAFKVMRDIAVEAGEEFFDSDEEFEKRMNQPDNSTQK